MSSGKWPPSCLRLYESRQILNELSTLLQGVSIYICPCNCCFPRHILTHWPLGDVAIILKLYPSNSCHGLNSCAISVKLLSGACQRTLLIISQNWVRQWLGTVRQQAITWANVDSDLCRHMASLRVNELTMIKPLPSFIGVTSPWTGKINILRPAGNGLHFADDILKCIFWN